jgi:hypothetical protein
LAKASTFVTAPSRTSLNPVLGYKVKAQNALCFLET